MASSTTSPSAATAEPSAFTWSEVPSEPDGGMAVEDMMDEDAELPHKPTLANRILLRLDDIDTTIYRIQSEPNTLLSDLLGYMAEGQITMSEGGRLPDSLVSDSKAASNEVRQKLDKVLAALASAGDGMDSETSIGARVSKIESLLSVLVESSLSSTSNSNPNPTPTSTAAAQAANDSWRRRAPDYSILDSDSSSPPSYRKGRVDISTAAGQKCISTAVTDGITTFLTNANRATALKNTVSRSLAILEYIPETKGMNHTMKMAKEELDEARRLEQLNERSRKWLASASGRLRVALIFLENSQSAQKWEVGILESVIDDLDTTAAMV
ncbi:hypothetical protein L198_06722 [Cryptococcus wingfieldii CBS 7118]|uniref:Uncharacterized protein n=1 Tax=Cryptococcus wingfieldii CBS 7118 TaxID=1295528 RepID=A0A1E3IIM5_9TREE|nr:hypothetical protein L198_06722 [Cryptococcus wingfieldii CBS 7118]ODN88450.1 hypothetical protein L198_06722 [Cryptococcus wingfieldii CBS 7118]